MGGRRGGRGACCQGLTRPPRIAVAQRSLPRLLCLQQQSGDAGEVTRLVEDAMQRMAFYQCSKCAEVSQRNPPHAALPSAALLT